MTRERSAIVIGGGHNGLVCSTYLAKAGYAVELFEARDRVGGGIAPREFGNGYKVPGLAHYHNPLNPLVVRELGLNLPTQVGKEAAQTIALDKSGQHLTLGVSSVSGDKLSDSDIKAYASFKEDFLAFAKALSPLMQNRPPRLKDMDWTDQQTLIKTGWALRFGLGAASMQEFLRVGGINIFDVLNECFESDALKGAIAFDAVIGQQMGPRTPTTVLTYLHRLFQEHAGASAIATTQKGLAEALENAAVQAGVTIHAKKPVRDIIVADGRATGVRLQDGATMEADLVVSNVDAKSTFLKMVGTPELDAMFAKRINDTRTNGCVAKLHLGLNGLPNFTGISDAQFANRFIIAPSMRYVEHAFNASKYGRYSEEPIVEIVFPSAQEQGLAPEGIHVASINASFAPYKLREGWDNGRDAFVHKIIDTIETYAPGFKNTIEEQEFLAPSDIEADYGVSGGHWHHGELAIDQSFMMRPVHGAAQYDTPIDGLYLCGAAAHPGGGVAGLPGRNAAKRIVSLRKAGAQ